MESIKISLAFMPCEKINAKIKGLKDVLKSLIGWYPSCNSAGHITICEFETAPNQLNGIISILREQLLYEHPQYVYFNDYCIFQHGDTYTYYIAPTIPSKSYFNQRSQVVIDALKNRYSLKSISKEPHLSIGRRLEENMIKEARAKMKNIDLDFYCDAVFVRLFNPQIKQYDLYTKIPFGGRKRAIEVGQLSFDF